MAKAQHGQRLPKRHGPRYEVGRWLPENRQQRRAWFRRLAAERAAETVDEFAIYPGRRGMPS